MNERTRLRIAEMKIEKHYSQGGLYPVCCKPVSVSDGELAHHIPQRKYYLAMYGPKVIHHSLNMSLTHPQCNNAVSIGNRPLDCEALAARIVSALGTPKKPCQG